MVGRRFRHYGGLDRDIGRYIGRCIDRYVGRYTVEYRSSIGRYLAGISADSRSSIGRVSIYTSADMCVDRYGCNLVDARPIPYRHFTDSLPIPYRHLVDIRSVYMIWNQYEGELVRRKAYFDFEFFFGWHYENVIPSFRRRSIPVDENDRHRTYRM